MAEAEILHEPTVPAERKVERRDATIATPWNLPSVWDLNASIEWLIQDLIPLNSVTLLSAASGTGKTWVAYAIAGAVAHGRPFLGRAVQRRPVLILDGENPLAIAKRNFIKLDIARTDNLLVWGGWHTAEPPGPKDEEILSFVGDHQPLLIWDSLVQFHTGDEQSAKDTRAFMKNFRNLANAGATVLILHHTGKTKSSKEYRGSSDIEAAVDMAYTLESTTGDGKLDQLTLKNFKSRFAEGGQVVGLKFTTGSGFEAVEVQPAAQAVSASVVVPGIIAANPGINGARIKELAKERGVGKNAVDKFLSGLPSTPGKGKEKLYYPREEVPEAPEERAA